MKQITIDCYEFSELDEAAKNKARAMDHNNDGPQEFDFEGVTEDAKQILQYLGFSDVQIAWTGFSSQGDGASFIGRWYAKDVQVGKTAEHAPIDEKLKSIAEEIEAFAKNNPSANVNLSRNSSHYVHEHSINFELLMEWQGNEAEFASETDQHKAIRRPMQSLMRWIYSQLNAVNDDWYSQEQTDERLGAYTYTKEGGRKVYLPNSSD
jgi:hypothetical protein